MCTERLRDKREWDTFISRRTYQYIMRRLLALAMAHWYASPYIGTNVSLFVFVLCTWENGDLRSWMNVSDNKSLWVFSQAVKNGLNHNSQPMVVSNFVLMNRLYFKYAYHAFKQVAITIQNHSNFGDLLERHLLANLVCVQKIVHCPSASKLGYWQNVW